MVLTYAKYCIFGDEYYNELIKSLLGKEIPKIKLNIADNPARIVHFLIQVLQLDLSDEALIQLLEYAAKKDNFLKLLFEPLEQTIANEAKGISIMTVHKSKGLEFDNVILLDTLSIKEPNDKNSLMLEYDTIKKVWELRFKDSIRPLTKEKSYNDFIEKRKIYDKDDATNKLYVAMTRAKKSLIIIKRNGKNTLFEGIECNEFGKLENEIIDKKEVNFEEFKLEPFEKVPKQEKTQSSVKSDEIYFGNAFHYFMQHYNFKEKNNTEKLCQIIKQKFHHFLDESAFNELFSRLKTLLSNTHFQELYKDKTLLKEQNLSFNGELKQIDLLCVSENEAVVIDYKTGVSDEDGHKKQVSLYKKAVENILQKAKTRAFIVYCLKDDIRIEKVD